MLLQGEVIAAHRANGNEKEAIIAVLGLAHAYGELGNNQECEKEHRKAFEQAKAFKDLALQSQCLRNLGLFYSEQDRIPEAEKTLKMAAKTGQQSNDETMFGRSLVALGIFLLHNSKLNDARKYLVKDVKLLEQTDPDGICGRSHLNAIENDQSCGCGDTSAAICEALRQEILNEVPEGYLSDVNVSLGDDGIQIGIEGARDLNEEEVSLVGRIVQQAQIDFRKRLEERS